jgi:hypothetical protein
MIFMGRISIQKIKFTKILCYKIIVDIVLFLV